MPANIAIRCTANKAAYNIDYPSTDAASTPNLNEKYVVCVCVWFVCFVLLVLMVSGGRGKRSMRCATGSNDALYNGVLCRPAYITLFSKLKRVYPILKVAFSPIQIVRNGTI